MTPFTAVFQYRRFLPVPRSGCIGGVDFIVVYTMPYFVYEPCGAVLGTGVQFSVDHSELYQMVTLKSGSEL